MRSSVGPVFDPAAPAARTAMVRDPDGVRVQLVEGDGTRIARVVITCTDLDAAFAYYRDVMGLRPEHAPVTAEEPAALHGLTADAAVHRARLADSGSPFAVELIEWFDLPVAARDSRPRVANELGLFRMAWSTDDCARDESVVRAAGSVPFASTGTLSVGDDLPLLNVLFWPGPSNECLELIEVTTAPGRLPA